MKKYLRLLSIFCALLVVLLAGYRISQNKTSIIPYPYDISNLKLPSYDAPIVIIGDQAATNLYRYQQSLAEKVSIELSNTIEIDNIASDNQGLHRLWGKLSKLTTWPKMMIYMGGSSEGFEKRIIPTELNKVNANFKKYNNDWFKTLLMFYPASSRLIYSPVESYVLAQEMTKDTYSYKDFEKTKRNELIFKLFKHELTELIETSKTKGSELILVTSPINLTLEPLDSCNIIDVPNAPTISQIKSTYDEKDYKSAFNFAEMRASLLIADPVAHYWKGIIAQKLGKRKIAIESLKLANAYDCSLNKPNIVFNAIIRDLAKEYQIPLFDFQKYLYADFGKNTLFFDKHTPQDLYMEKLTGFLARKIKIMLKI